MQAQPKTHFSFIPKLVTYAETDTCVNYLLHVFLAENKPFFPLPCWNIVSFFYIPLVGPSTSMPPGHLQIFSYNSSLILAFTFRSLILS